MHEMIEKLAEYGKRMVDEGTGSGNVNLEETKCVVEMVEKLAEAEYHARIAKAMEEADKEEEEDIKHLIKKMKEEGEDWDEDEARRFYRGQPRSQTSGRFMSRNDGRRSNRGKSRGYEEPMYYGMMPEIYDPMEHMRDVDREQGRMYFSSGGNGGNSGGGSSSGTSSSGVNSGNSSRGYSEGYSDGQTRGYSEGYERGRNEGERNRRQSESRSERARRSYTETKEMHKGNSPEEKQKKMKGLEDYMRSLSEDVTDMINDASPEEKALLKQKMQVLMQKI